jgi:gamma-glutamyl phosphate reductase
MLRVYGQSGDIHNTLIILKGSKERGPSTAHILRILQKVLGKAHILNA